MDNLKQISTKSNYSVIDKIPQLVLHSKITIKDLHGKKKRDKSTG